MIQSSDTGVCESSCDRPELFHGTISFTCYKSVQERNPPLQFQLIRETDAAGRIDAVHVVSEQVPLVTLYDLERIVKNHYPLIKCVYWH